MAERFNLTAQLQLQGPTNTRQVANQIRKQLEPIGNINVQVQADTRPLKSASDQLNQLNKAARQSNKSVSELNRTIAESARRFSVITVATGTLLGFVNSLKNSTKAAIEFEREVVKISQVTGKSAGNLKSLTDEVSRLATTLGTSSAELLNVSRTLLQTGLSAEKTRKALEVLAQTSLGATFDSIQDTTEGAIALLRQFGTQSRKTGTEIAFLRQSLDSINSVSKSFAVESGDLVTAIRRVGGVFAAAGGNVNELIALFTSVRATTRESAETIATGLRTIFTRIQRGETVNQLKELGIQLQDSKGNFVGAFEAFKRLSQGLSGLDPKSFRFSEIVEQLGGFRQVGKVIPLIQQFTTAQQALVVAQKATGSVARDAQTAQGSLAVQIEKTREKFDELIRTFTNSTTFRSVITFSLQLAQSFITATRALEPLVPLLTALFAIKIGKGLGTGLGALANFGRGGGGAPVSKFARGGMVPGSGNTDSVPAMLTPGEFVIRKSSVKKLGASNLAAMNQNRYSHGGDVKKQTRTSQATNFTHISEISSRRQAGIKGISSRLGGREIVKAYTNMGLDLPASWNKDWNTPRNNHGVFREKLVNYIRSKPVFKTLTGQGNSIYRLAEDNKQNQLLQGAMKQNASNIRADLASSLTSGTRQFFDVDPEVYTSDLGPKLIKSVEKNAPELSKAVQRVSAIKTEGASRRSLAGVAKGGYKNPIASEFSKRVNRFFGGPVQKFNLGGIVKSNKVGAAILEADKGAKTDSIKVGINDIKPYIPGSGFDKTKAQKNFGKVTGFAGKSYTLFRKGLNQKTSENFSNVLFSETAEGINKSVQRLSNDLGLGSVSLDNKGILSDTLRKTGIVGALFESTLNTLQNRGTFSPEAANAPFDFPGGLSGKLADNYSGLPSSWIDAKSSFKEASVAAFKKKIAREISDEYVRSGDYAKALSGKGFASGGGIAGGDTVPAMLTPGEFVFSKKSADKIGRGNLNRMNKQGVQGFAKGGPVGFRNGGNVAGQVQNVSFGALGLVALAQQFEILDEALGSTISQVAGYTAGVSGIVSALTSMRTGLIAQSQASDSAAQSDRLEAAASKELVAAKKLESTTAKTSGVRGRIGQAITPGKFTTGVGTAALLSGAALQAFETNFNQAAEAAAKDIKGFGDAAKEGAEVNFAEVQKTLKKESEARIGAATVSAGKTIATFTQIGSAFGPVGTAIGIAVGVILEFNNIMKLLTGEQQKELNLIARSTTEALKLTSSFAKINKALEKTEGLFGVSEDFKGSARLDAASKLGTEIEKFTKGNNFQLVEKALNETGLKFAELSSRELPSLTEDLRGTGLSAEAVSVALKSTEESTKQLADAQRLAGSEFQRQIQKIAPGLTLDDALKNAEFKKAMDEYTGLIALQGKVAIAMAKAAKVSPDEIKELEKEFKRILGSVSSGVRQILDSSKAAFEIAEREKFARIALIEQLEQEKQTRSEFSRNRQELSRVAQATESAANAGSTGELRTDFLLIKAPNLDADLPFADFVDNLKILNQDFASLTPELRNKLKSLVDSIISNREFNESISRNARQRAGLSRNEIEAEIGMGATSERIAEFLDIDLGDFEKIYGSKAKSTFEDFLLEIFKDGNITSQELDDLNSLLSNYNKIESERIKTVNEVIEAERLQYRVRVAQFKAEEAARKRAIDNINRFAGIFAGLDDAIAKVRGETVSAAERERQERIQRQKALNANIEGRGGIGLRAGDVEQLAARKREAEQRRRELIDISNRTQEGGIDGTELADFYKEMEQQNNIIKDVNTELEAMAKAAGDTSDVLREFEKAQRRQQQQFALLQEFVLGGPDQRASLEQAARGIVLAINTGTLQNQTPDQRSATFGLLDRLSDVIIGNTGLTGSEVQQRLIIEDAVRLGFSREFAEQLADSQSIEQRALDQLKQQTSLLRDIKAARADDESVPPLPVPVARSRGGAIYRNEGGTIFQPKGTDTVPAMLTPGEFVIRKSAVDKIGVGNLQAINSGMSPIYRAQGGIVDNMHFTDAMYKGANNAGKGDLIAYGTQAGMRLPDFFADDFIKARTSKGVEDALSMEQIDASNWLRYLEFVRQTARKRYGRHGSAILGISESGVSFNPIAHRNNPNGIGMKKDLKDLLRISQSLKLDTKKDTMAALFAAAGQGVDPYQQKAMLESEIIKFLNNPPNQRQSDLKERSTRNQRMIFPNKDAQGGNTTDAEYAKQQAAKRKQPAKSSAQKFKEDVDTLVKTGLKSYKIEDFPSEGAYYAYDSKVQNDADAKTRAAEFKASDDRLAEMEANRQKGLQEIRDRQKADRLAKTKQGFTNLGGSAVNLMDSLGMTEKGREAAAERQAAAAERQAAAAAERKANRDKMLAIGQQFVTGMKDQMRSKYEGSPEQFIYEIPKEGSDVLGPELTEARAKNQMKAATDPLRRMNNVKLRELSDFASGAILNRGRLSRENIGTMMLADRSPIAADQRSELQKIIDSYAAYVQAYQPTFGNTTGEGFVGSLVQDAGDGQTPINTSNAARYLTPFGTLSIGSMPENILQGTGDKAMQQRAAARGVLMETAALEALGFSGKAVDIATGVMGAGKKVFGAGKQITKEAFETGKEFTGISIEAAKEVGDAVNAIPTKLFPPTPPAPKGIPVGSPPTGRPTSLLDEMAQDARLFADPRTPPRGNLPIEADAAWDELLEGQIYRPNQQLKTTPTSTTPKATDVYKQRTPSQPIVSSVDEYDQYVKLRDAGELKGTAIEQQAQIQYGLGRRPVVPESPPVPMSKITLDAMKMNLMKYSESAQGLAMKATGAVTGAGLGGTFLTLSSRDLSYPTNDYMGMMLDQGSPVNDSELSDVSKRNREKLFKLAMIGAGLLPRAAYRAQGGATPTGNDRVPAMLTPGEFIMSPEAVNKYGVGYMQNLNRGRVPGFRRGGIVGRGNVQYHNDGGIIGKAANFLGIDTSKFEGILGVFNNTFESLLTGITGQFAGLGSSITSLANVFSKGMNMSHTFSGDMTIAFSITNLPELQDAISKAMQPKIEELIVFYLSEQNKQLRS